MFTFILTAEYNSEKMKFGEILILTAAVCCLFPETAVAGTSSIVARQSHLVPHKVSEGGAGASQRIYAEWIKKLCGDGRGRKFFKRDSSMSDADGGDSGDDSGDSSDSSASSSEGSMMTTLKSLLKRLPQTNFYSTIPNAVGVVGQGFSVLEKVSIALGTPLPYFIGSLPIVVFGIALVFIPDLTTLSLPGFYPNGAGEHDPLAAFPPFPDLDGLPDVDLSLRPDNIPFRIIPPSSDSKPDLSNQLSPPSESANIQEEEETDSPTNPESFQSPRRRIGEEPARVQYVKAKPLSPYQPAPSLQHLPQPQF